VTPTEPTPGQVLFGELLSSLLPPGIAWNRAKDSRTRALLEGLAAESARVQERQAALQAEADPRTAVETIDEWEDMLGLPSACTGPLRTLEQRRGAAAARYLDRGGQSPSYFVALAAQLGFQVTIREHRPFVCGRSRAGDPLDNPGNPFRAGGSRAGQRLGTWTGWSFVWDVVSPDVTVRRFRAGVSRAGDSLGEWGNDLLECVLREAAPAHTLVRFRYRVTLTPDPVVATVAVLPVSIL